MKILEVNKFFYPRRGAERHFLDLIHLLREGGHEVRVFSMQHPDNERTPDEQFFPSYVGYNSGEGTVWQKLVGIGRLFYSFEARHKLEQFLQVWQPEVAHLHNIYHQLSPSILKSLKKRDIRIVMTAHDYNLISPDKDCYYPEVGKQYYRFLFIKKYSFAKRLLLVAKKYFEDVWGFYNVLDTLIVPSQYVANIFSQAGFLKEKLQVLPHFTDFSISAEPAVLPREVPKGAFALAYGSLSLNKGTTALVEMFTELQYPLLLVGTPEAGYTVPESAYVTHLPSQDKAILEQLILKSVLVVGASTLPETFGLVPLETITLGKPFIGLATGAYGEIIENGKNGYLAHDTAELKTIIEQCIQGKMVFDSQTIRHDAEVRFSRAVYLQKITALMQKR